MTHRFNHSPTGRTSNPLTHPLRRVPSRVGFNNYGYSNMGKYKEKYLNILPEDIILGNNPHSFTNRIQSLLMAQSPNRGTLMRKQEAIRKLEQISSSNWDQVKQFIKEYTYHALLPGCFYDEGIIEKLILKLPEQLEKTIYDSIRK